MSFLIKRNLQSFLNCHLENDKSSTTRADPEEQTEQRPGWTGVPEVAYITMICEAQAKKNTPSLSLLT